MKFQVRVKPNSSEQKIEEFGDNRYLVYVESPAEKNEANIELINLMAKHLGIPASKIKIVSGLTNKDKTLEIVY
jgi:uncharacterized protein YggU (UPF0235/DUF167 family)